MDSNICLFRAFEKCTMAFCGSITQECWNRMLRAIDDMSHVAISQALGEGVFSVINTHGGPMATLLGSR